MAKMRLDDLRKAVENGSLSTQQREQAQITITLADNLIEAINDLRNAVVLSGLATGAVAGFAGAPHAQEMGDTLGGDKAVKALASLAGQLRLV